jgi:3-oxoacyl-[acyl-carrier-protein] synthase II
MNFGRGDGTPTLQSVLHPQDDRGQFLGPHQHAPWLRGPSYVTASACASSNNAMIDAFNYIRLGHGVAVVTGGSEAAIYEAGVGGFNALHAMSTRNDDPPRPAGPMTRTAMASCWAKAVRPSSWRTWNMPRPVAPRSTQR